MFSRNHLRKSMIIWVSQHSSSDACLDTPRMQMSLSIHWHGTSVPSISGRKRIVMASSSAALNFSCGATKKLDVTRTAEISPGRHSWKETRWRASGRIQQADHRAQEKHKQYRLAQRQSKQREEDLHVTREGITYEAGGFDETKLCRVGKKRKNLWEPKHTFK